MTRYARSDTALPGTRPWDTTGNGALAVPKSLEPTQQVPYYCGSGHEDVATFAADAEAPPERDCPRCGLPAGLDKDHPPAPPAPERYRTHLGYVKDRRSKKEAEEILAEAWARVRQGGFNR